MMGSQDTQDARSPMICIPRNEKCYVDQCLKCMLHVTSCYLAH